jgi:hypothetical protein
MIDKIAAAPGGAIAVGGFQSHHTRLLQKKVFMASEVPS